jgi:hypothetical protein
MVALIFPFLNLIASLLKSRSRLEAENAALRHQLIVLQRKVRGRVEFTNSDPILDPDRFEALLGESFTDAFLSPSLWPLGAPLQGPGWM